MTKRAEVEALLAEVHAYTGRKSGLIAELCRTWLAVQDAAVCTLIPGDNPGSYEARTLNAAAVHGCYMLRGHRVRLVPDGDACIGGGEGK